MFLKKSSGNILEYNYLVHKRDFMYLNSMDNVNRFIYQGFPRTNNLTSIWYSSVVINLNDIALNSCNS